MIGRVGTGYTPGAGFVGRLSRRPSTRTTPRDRRPTARATRRACTAQWRAGSHAGARRGAVAAVDAGPAAVVDFLDERAERSKLATVRRAAAAIGATCRRRRLAGPDGRHGCAASRATHARQSGAAAPSTYDQARARRRPPGERSWTARSSGCCSAGGCGAPRPPAHPGATVEPTEDDTPDSSNRGTCVDAGSRRPTILAASSREVGRARPR